MTDLASASGKQVSSIAIGSAEVCKEVLIISVELLCRHRFLVVLVDMLVFLHS